MNAAICVTALNFNDGIKSVRIFITKKMSVSLLVHHFEPRAGLRSPITANRIFENPITNFDEIK